jgi:aminoglycoside phosphotransferase (APT) family kinase protein
MIPRMPDDPFERWLTDATGDPGPFEFQRLSGGNSNESLAVSSPSSRWVVRRPPPHLLSPGAHAMAREYAILSALADQPVPSPRPVALCTDDTIPQTPALVMERVAGASLTDTLPDDFPQGVEGVRASGEAVIDAMAALHAVPWREVGLKDFGRPDGFLERQVARWRRQFDGYAVRELPLVNTVGQWLERERPVAYEPGILHGDLHMDNCLIATVPDVHVSAIIDWEMATIGDPLVDLGLFLAFWGPDRPDAPAMPRVQGLSRVAGAPTRKQLAARYGERSDRDISRLDWYMTFAFWKLAVIVEGAYAQYRNGQLVNQYAAALEHDVPTLLSEAAEFAGLRS